MYRFKIPIGDWSNDGHGRCDTYIIESNHPVQDLQLAYKASCRLTGVSFNHNNDFIGLNRDWREAERYHIATDYQDSRITEEVETILLNHGIDIRENWDYAKENPDEEMWIDGHEHFIELLMKFIKLSLPTLQYNIVEDELPYLNGFWNAELNVQFGYGLFG